MFETVNHHPTSDFTEKRQVKMGPEKKPEKFTIKRFIILGIYWSGLLPAAHRVSEYFRINLNINFWDNVANLKDFVLYTVCVIIIWFWLEIGLN